VNLPVRAALLLAAVPGGLRDVPVALTVSGGVSLGAYEAGYLYCILAAQRANPGSFRTVIATGASAGSVNALPTLDLRRGGRDRRRRAHGGRPLPLRAPRSTAWLSLGRALEIGGDWAVTDLSWLRHTGALELMNLVTAFGSSPFRWPSSLWSASTRSPPPSGPRSSSRRSSRGAGTC
jgi:predicted acylesterase/phospholipase RssA